MLAGDLMSRYLERSCEPPARDVSRTSTRGAPFWCTLRSVIHTDARTEQGILKKVGEKYDAAINKDEVWTRLTKTNDSPLLIPFSVLA